MDNTYYSIRNITKCFSLSRAFKQVLERSQVTLEHETMLIFKYMRRLGKYEYYEIDDEVITVSGKEFHLDVCQRQMLKRYIFLKWTNVMLGPPIEEEYNQELMNKILNLEPNYSLEAILNALIRCPEKVNTNKIYNHNILRMQYFKCSRGKILNYRMYE